MTLRDLRIRNSPQMHLRFDYSKSVVIDNIIINTPALSPNTDGIHVSGSQSVGIYNSAISTGEHYTIPIVGICGKLCNESYLQTLVVGR